MNQSWMSKPTVASISKSVGLEPERTPAPEPIPIRLAPESAPERRRNIVSEWYDRVVSSSLARKKAADEEEKSRLGRARRVVLRGISVFASVSCMVASVYFSYRGLVESQPPAIAGIMALTIVLTLSSAPELAVAMLRRRRIAVAAVAMSIALVAMVFSMSQTVQEIYNAKSYRIQVAEVVADEEIEARRDESAAAASIAVLQARLDRLNTSIATDQASMANYQTAIDARLAVGEDPNSEAIRLLVANRNAARYRLLGDSRSKGLMAQATDAENEIIALAPAAVAVIASEEKAVQRRLDFAAWLGDRLGAEADQVEFIQSALPAMFIDIIAPVMMVVAFAL